MTYEEAKECVIYFKSNPETEDTETIECANILFDKILEALEKQIPKKPHNVEDKYWACPNCQDLLMVRWVTYPTNPVPLEAGRPYCECCGQHLKWNQKK